MRRIGLCTCPNPRDNRMTMPKRPYNSATRAVRAGIAADLQYGAVVPPIHLSSTFEFEAFGKQRTYDYTRSGNPTRAHLAATIADLEGGAGAVVTSSGMSSVALVLQALVKPGDVVLAAHDCYGGTHRILRALAARGHFEVDFADLSVGATYWQNLVRAPRLVWVETPSNPLLRITDIKAVCEAAHLIGSQVVVDNTFLSPALQRPMELGADIVVHSTTKYLNGHSDVVGGAVVARTPEQAQELGWWANCLGVTGAPFDSYLTLRGLRTLSARMRVHEENASEVADLLASHDAVDRVYYPGLSGHPGYAVARRQQLGFGAMISFEVKGGLKGVEHVVHSLRHFTLAESLGGVESLVAHPATMTHAAMAAEARERAGIKDSLLRLSVGIEAADDLCADILHSLNGVAC